MDIGELYSEFKKQPKVVLHNEYWRGVKDFAAFLMQRQSAQQSAGADALPLCEISRECYFGEDGKCLRGGECR